ncbi:MAG: LuxR C-terminal-related transcriptional regulator [Actinomycetota bacterium]|nr:LuxR C-terminal-related transcriptional regulator [Actinomycetota bacterium]
MSLSRTGQQENDILSNREREVLTLLAQGRSNLQIASALFTSNGTVERHLTNICNKLGSSSRLSAVQTATRLGLLADTPADYRGQALHRPQRGCPNR